VQPHTGQSERKKPEEARYPCDQDFVAQSAVEKLVNGAGGIYGNSGIKFPDAAPCDFGDCSWISHSADFKLEGSRSRCLRYGPIQSPLDRGLQFVIVSIFGDAHNLGWLAGLSFFSFAYREGAAYRIGIAKIEFRHRPVDHGHLTRRRCILRPDVAPDQDWNTD